MITGIEGNIPNIRSGDKLSASNSKENGSGFEQALQQVEQSSSKDVYEGETTRKPTDGLTEAMNKTSTSKVIQQDQTVSLEEEEAGCMMQSMMQGFFEKIAQLLSVSVEELQGLIDSMGMEKSDLLDVNQLLEVCMKQFGANDLTDALLNEDLANVVSDATKLLEELLENTNGGLLDTMDAMEENPLTKDSLETKEPLIPEKQLVTMGQSVEEEETPSNGFSSKEDVEVVVNDQRKSRNETKEVSQEGFANQLLKQVDTSLQASGQVGEIQGKDIVYQITEQIKVNITNEKTSMELLLNPENLGKVHVAISSKEGMLTAHFTVQNEIAKEAIESSLQVLKESFLEQGLKVEDVEVTLGNYTLEYGEEDGEQHSNEKNGGKRTRTIEEIDRIMGSEVESQVETELGNINGSINYTA